MKSTKQRKEKTAASTPLWVVALVLFVVTLAAYWNSFDASFVFDDQSTIQRNIAVRSGSLNWNIFTPRGLLFLTFTLNYKLSGLNVWGYHVVNFLLHLANGWLVFLLGQHLLQKRSYAMLAAALFLLHPVQTESVTYISTRSELLSTLFYLAGLLVFMRWPRMQVGFLCSVAVAALYFFGLTSKEPVITLPATILLYDFLFRSDATLRMFRERWRFYGTFLVATPLAIYFLVTRILKDTIGSQLVGNLSAGHYFLTELRVIVRYIQILFVPVGLNLDYDFRPSLSAAEPAVIASFVFLVAILVFGWMLRKTQPVLAFSILWFFITLSPTSSFVPINDVIFEHRLYLPLAGVCFAFPLLVSFIYERGTVALCAGLLIACVVGTYQRNNVWATEQSLWADVVEKSPKKYRPRMHLANAYQQAQRYPDALREFEISTTLTDGLPAEERTYVRQMAGTSMAVLLIQMGQFDQAVAVATPLWQEFPGLPGIGASLAAVALQKRQPQQAIALIDESLKAIDENRWKGNTREAERGYLYSNKGEAYKLMGNCTEAIALYEKAAKIDPDIHVPSCP
jgi:hypothetical protein